jgi:hypothetical protein
LYIFCLKRKGGFTDLKAKLVPLYLKSSPDEKFYQQTSNLKTLFKEEIDLLNPIPLGEKLPEADAVIFPQILGEAYRKIDDFYNIKLPILVITSEFGTVSMWDWEVVSYLKMKGLEVFAPYNIEMSKKILKCLALKREMKTTKFLIFQENPGKGMQASIFKRFYWWEKECTEQINRKFGIGIIRKSLKQLAEEVKKIPEEEVAKIQNNLIIPIDNVTGRALGNALKLYLAVKKEIDWDATIKGIGTNCLNESYYFNTTPCLAWDLLFQEKGIMWACEADTLSLLTQHILYNILETPIMMSNVYPFLMGMAALKHEKIDSFPEIQNPDDHLLVAHCGYFGLIPRSFSNQWKLKPRVLEIVHEDATAIDGRFPEGKVTLAKIDSSLSSLLVVEGHLEKYVQFPGSDCRNGALIRVPDGHFLMNKLYSHHNCILIGHHKIDLEVIASVIGLDIEVLS